MTLRRGEPVYRPGDRSDHVYLVLRGSLKRVGRAPEGDAVLLTVLTAGDIFGELAVVDGGVRDHGVEAGEEALICALPREVVTQLVRDSPLFGAGLNRRIGWRVRLLRSRLQELLGKSAPARLAHALLDLSEHHGVADDEGMLIPLPLSQSDLASLVGLTRETVNGIVRAWRAQGMLEMDRRSIRLRDPDRLSRMR